MGKFHDVNFINLPYKLKSMHCWKKILLVVLVQRYFFLKVSQVEEMHI
ncbi:hypothetical protein [Maledivibacter halophilus]|nr:hypothetical protein [Maledivibacter halophilus]